MTCGQRLREGGRPAVRPAPRAYTPMHLVERILGTRAATEGERKQVTVLFADLKSSMELLAARDPEEARALLDPVLECMMAAVHQYQGIVNQVMGDGIMALFGAPLALEDHAVRAAYAALRMHDAVRAYAGQLPESRGAAITIRVGLNSGEVVVRSIGSDLRMDYSAVGQTTHLASRMEQAARPGSTLVTGATAALIEGYVALRPLGALGVKGVGSPLEVFEVVGPGQFRSRLQAAAARGLSPFVGRTAEMERLVEAREHVRAGRGQVVAVLGDAGIGKSRLLWEFLHSARMNGWRLLESQSMSHGQASSYRPIVDLLRAYFEVKDRDDPDTIRFRIASELLRLDASLGPFVPAFLALVDVPVEDAEWAGLDPPRRRARTIEGVRRLLARESQRQPIVLAIEDLHWADSETRAVLDALVDLLPACPILLIVSYRPDFDHAWDGKSSCVAVRLDPLPSDAASELLTTLLGDDAGLAPLKRLLGERTAGNPLFVEESIRTLVETRALSGTRGAYRIVAPLPAIQIPRFGARPAGRPHRPAGPGGQAPAGVGGRRRQGCAGPVAGGDRRARRGRPLARPRPAPGRRASVREAPLPGPGIHLQARADPRGGLRGIAEGAPPRASRPGRRRHRDPPSRSPDRARRAAGLPRPAQRALAGRGRLLPAGRVKSGGPLGQPGRRGRLRPGSGGPRTPAGGPRRARPGVRPAPGPPERPGAPRRLPARLPGCATSWRDWPGASATGGDRAWRGR